MASAAPADERCGGSSSSRLPERKAALRQCLDRWRSELDGWPPLLPRRVAPRVAEEQHPEGLRVLGFNLLADGKQGEEQWECTPADALNWTHRRWLLLEEMTVHEPDVLLLQEVDAEHFEAFFQPELARAGYSGAFRRMPDSRPDGVAVFWSAASLSLVSTHEFELHVSREAALAVALRVNEPGAERSLVVASAHLRSGKNEASELAREAQVRELLDGLQALAGGAPVVLAADFNAEPTASAKSGPPLALPAALGHQLGLRNAYPDAPYTTWKRRPAGEVRRTIDYILYSPQQLELTGVLDLPSPEEVPPERLPCLSYPSDHFALLAVLRPV